MRKLTNEINEQIESEPFTLNLPEGINVTPDWEVTLPKGKKALIYKIPRVKETSESFTAYSVFIIHGAKATSNRKDLSYYREYNQFTDLPTVKHFLTDLAAKMAINKRVTKQTDTDESDD